MFLVSSALWLELTARDWRSAAEVSLVTKKRFDKIDLKGDVFGALVVGVSRNPSLEQRLFRLTILGFALTEAMALFALMMAFLILFTF